MTVDDKKKELASYRLQQAAESIEEAEVLLAAGKSPRSVVNRTYYSMFYAILALLIFEPFASSKHSGVISYFNRRFIREGVFPERLGRAVNKAFELRQQADYREHADVTVDMAAPFVAEARELLQAIKIYLSLP